MKHAVIDHTTAFHELVRMHQGRPASTAVVVPVPPSTSKGKERQTLPVQISQVLFATTQRLGELTTLARVQTPFGDQGMRVDALTHHVKGDLAWLQQALGTLEERVHGGKEGNDDAHAHTQGMMHTLQEHLRDTTHGFEQALQTRVQTLRDREMRRSRIGAVTSVVPPPAEDEDAQPIGELSVLIEMPRARSTLSIELMTERARQIQDIEANIVEVHGAFRKLAELVAVDGEKIARIEDNIVEADVHVQEAHRQLLQYLGGIQGNWWLAAKIFGVLLLFIILFVLFFV